MKKKMAAVWLICFASLLLMPGAIWAVAKERFAAEATENTVPEKPPQLTRENYKDFAASFEEYYNYSVPFRSQLITLNSLVEMKLFREKCVNDKVIIGDENWLFYSAESDIDDYKGTNLFTQERLRQIADNLKVSQEYLDKRGCEFVLFIPPNKESVYGEEMLPSYYKKWQKSRAEQLTDYLRENTDIRVVYPLEEMKACRDRYSLYWHYDTHWNAAGAYIGGSALLEELGIKMPPMEKITVTQNDDSGYDLARMLNLQSYYEKKMPKDVNYIVTGYDTNDLRAVQDDNAAVMIFHSDAPDKRKLFLLHDSFANSVARVLASNFRDTYMLHWDGFSNPSQIEKQDPDVFVLEVVERRLDYLDTFRLEG